MQSYFEAVAALENLQFKNTSERIGGKAEKEASVEAFQQKFVLGIIKKI